MKPIPHCYYTPPIISLIKEQIESGHETYSSLDEIQRDKLATFCIEALEDSAYSCIIDHADLYKTIYHLKNYILNADMDEGYELLNTLKKNAVYYFEEDMDNLFYKLSDEVFLEKKIDQGFYPVQSKDNGEITWIKF